MTLTVADRQALADLVHRYAAAVDDRRFHDVVELFTEAAELRLPDPPHVLEPNREYRGPAAIGSAMAPLVAIARTEHAIIGEVYSAGSGPNQALGRIACIAHHWSRSAEHITDLVWHLRYDDEYLLTEAGWRIHRRALTVNAMETRPVRRLR